MKKTKRHRFYHNWTFGGVLIVILLIILVGSLITHVIMFGIDSDRKNNSFTNSDWEYMINYIETEYGNGKEFIVLKKESDEITKKVKSWCLNDYEVSCYDDAYIGEKANIIGNFENDDTGYFVTFSRYITDSPYKSGNNVIIHVYTNDNYSIEEYK